MRKQKRRGGHGRPSADTNRTRTPSAPPAPKAESAAMAQLHEAMERTDLLDGRKKAYVPKPRAIRRYEKFASMGEEK